MLVVILSNDAHRWPVMSGSGSLFPGLMVNEVTKRFAALKEVSPASDKRSLAISLKALNHTLARA